MRLTVHEPDWSEIVKRRFGSRHEKPCARPTVLTCALVECQIANKCRRNPAKRQALQGEQHDD